MTNGGTHDRADPSPYAESQFSEFKPVGVGIAIWVVLLVLAVVFRHDLDADGHAWWVWTALAGVVEGLFGFAYLQRRAARAKRYTTANAPEVTSPGPRTPDRS